MSKQDPKHGRWILPIVVAALIGFTYVLVNALPAAELEGATTTTTIASAADTTTTTVANTTSTTLDPVIVDFLALVATYRERARSIESDVTEVNDAWEADETSFGETRDGFGAAREEAQTLADDVAAAEVPDLYQDLWPEAITTAQALPVGIDAVLAGLAAPDDGTARREAVDAYGEATLAFLAALDAIGSPAG